jgi:hypothetical protein
MMWAKTPAAAGSIFCAVCIAAASVLPAVGPAADRLANAVSSDVSLKVRFDKLANFDAIPIYQALAGGDLNQLVGLSSVNATLIYLSVALGGDVNALGALDSLSAVPVYAAAIAAGDGNPARLAGIDNFSGIPGLQKIANGDRTGLYDNATTNATQAFDKWAATGFTDLGAFEPNASTDPALFNSGYAALSGANTWAKANASGNVADLAGIDAFSAIPALQVLGNPASTQADIWAAQRSLASVSAIPEYQDAPDPPPPPPPPVMTLAKVAEEPAVVDTTPTVDDVTPTAKTAEKPSNGSYSASFSPPSLVLFGSGGGKNAEDNGMRGYGNFLKAVGDGISGALGGAPAPSAPSADASGATP